MIQFFKRIFPAAETACERDILQHPAIASMDARQIADLPMPRRRAPADEDGPACGRQKNGVLRGGSADMSM